MKFPNNGFTIIEVMVSIMVLAVGIVGIYYIVPKLASISAINTNRFIAAQLAREGLEIIKNLRDSNWLGEADWNYGFLPCASGCEIDYNDSSPAFFQNRFLRVGTNGFYNYQSGEATKFKRKITVTPGTDTLEVEVEVIWAGKYSPYTAKQRLYNWR